MQKLRSVVWILITVLLVTCGPAWAAPTAVSKFGDIIVKGPWLDSRAYSTLAQADSAAVVSGRELLITTNYVISSATILSSHVRVVPGGRLTQSGSGTLAITGGFECPDNYQVFYSFGPGEVTGLKVARAEWWGEELSSVQAAISSSNYVILPPKNFVCSKIQLHNDLTVIGTGQLSVLTMKDNNNDHLFLGNNISNITLKNFKIDGNKDNQSLENSPIFFDSCSDVRIENITCVNAYGSDEDATHVANNSSLGGITLKNCFNSTVKDSFVTLSRRSGLVIIGSSSDRITVIGGNYSNNSYSGIVTSNAPNVTMIAPSAWNNGTSNISINGINNKLVSPDVGGSVAESGINIGHDDVNLNASGSQVIGGSSQNNASKSGVVITGGINQRQNNIVVSGMQVKNNYDGIKLIDSDNCTVIANSFSSNLNDGIRVDGDNNKIVSNRSYNNTRYGYHTFSPTAKANILTDNNFNQNIANIYDLGLSTVIDNVLTRKTEIITSTGALTETDISTVIVPGGLLSQHGSLRVRVFGTKTGTAGMKTIKIYVGGIAITSVNVADAGNWEIELTLVNSTSGLQRVMYKVWNNGGLVLHNFSNQTIDTTSDFTIKTTHTIASGGDTISQRWFEVDLFGDK